MSIWEPAPLPPTYIQHSWTLVISNILNSDQFCSYFWYSNSKFFTTTSSLNDEMLVKIVFIPSRYCRSEMWKSSSRIGQSLQSSYKSIIIFKQFQLKFDVLNLLPCCNTLTSIPSIKDKQLFCFFALKIYIPLRGISPILDNLAHQNIACNIQCISCLTRICTNTCIMPKAVRLIPVTDITILQITEVLSQKYVIKSLNIKILCSNHSHNKKSLVVRWAWNGLYYGVSFATFLPPLRSFCVQNDGIKHNQGDRTPEIKYMNHMMHIRVTL